MVLCCSSVFFILSGFFKSFLSVCFFASFFLFSYFLIFNNFYFNNFISFSLISFFLSFFFSPFSSEPCGWWVLALQPGVRPVPLRWESWVQDIGPQETSQFHVISNDKSSRRDLHLNAKTQLQSTTSKLQCWTPHAKQLATGTQLHPSAERLPKIIIRSQTPQNTLLGVVLPNRKTRSSLIHQNTGTSPLHQEAYTTHRTNLSHWGQTPKTTGTTNLQAAKRRPQTQ